MSPTKAIKTYFEQDPHGRKVDAKELLAFKASMAPDEYREIGRLCCVELGQELEAA